MSKNERIASIKTRMDTSIEVPYHMMEKVVAKQHGVPSAVWEWNTHGYGDPYFFTNDTPEGHGMLVLCGDPRENPNEALMLLHWIIENNDSGYCFHESGWMVEITTQRDKEYGMPILGCSYIIPISGDEFCIGVCKMAVAVLGVE